MVHCTSVAVVDRPLALVAAVVAVAAVGTGVAQIHGEGWTLSRIEPLSGWLVTVSEAPENEPSLDVAVTVLAPLASPVTRPTVVPVWRVVKALVTSVVPTLDLEVRKHGAPERAAPFLHQGLAAAHHVGACRPARFRVVPDNCDGGAAGAGF